jgi:hypothetical protein
MTTEKYNELHDKYKPWIGRPVELLRASRDLEARTYKKVLLKDIALQGIEAEGGEESVTSSVLIQDLEDSHKDQMNLSDFDEAVRLIQLGNAPFVKLSKGTKTINIELANSSEQIEVFIIQLNSHFGLNAEDWSKVAENIYIDFHSKATNDQSSALLERVYLSTLISNQTQPVFNISKKYCIETQSKTGGLAFYNMIQCSVGEVTPMEEGYEITVVYNLYA